MPVRSVRDLMPDARAVIEEYLAAVEDGLCGVDRHSVDDVLADASAHILERLSPDSSADQVRFVTDAIGEPDVFGSELCRVMGEASRVGSGEPDSTGASGRVLGIPIDVRFPTAQRVANAWWNPRDARLWMPRVWGLGWDLNYGAVAVRLGLIRPDDEDEPFGEVDESTFARALLVPVSLTLAVYGSFAAVRSELGPELPVHWSLSGVPDRFAPTLWSFAALAALATAPTVWAAWSVVMRRPPLARGAVIGFASLMSALAASVWLLTLISAFGGPEAWWVGPLLILGSLLVPLAVLVWLARSGRMAEIARDATRTRQGGPL